ncbi:MAG: hypothetical protein L0Y71_26075 [Gemmataceae bacterium]|nr:hypothetical protein [Gemmataceae bacterium]
MKNPIFALAGGLLALAGLLSFAPVQWPAVAPVTAAIAGAVMLASRTVSRSPAAPEDSPATPSGDRFPRMVA